jgi:DnaJ-class molecular chaperone
MIKTDIEKEFELFDRCVRCAGDGKFADHSDCENCMGTGKQSIAERLKQMKSFQ